VCEREREIQIQKKRDTEKKIERERRQGALGGAVV